MKKFLKNVSNKITNNFVNNGLIGGLLRFLTGSILEGQSTGILSANKVFAVVVGIVGICQKDAILIGIASAGLLGKTINDSVSYAEEHREEKSK